MIPFFLQFQGSETIVSIDVRNIVLMRYEPAKSLTTLLVKHHEQQVDTFTLTDCTTADYRELEDRIIKIWTDSIRMLQGIPSYAHA